MWNAVKVEPKSSMFTAKNKMPPIAVKSTHTKKPRKIIQKNNRHIYFTISDASDKNKDVKP